MLVSGLLLLITGFWFPVANSVARSLEILLISSLLFRHGFTARLARAAEIAEELFFNFLLSPAKEQRDVNKGRKLKIQALRAIASCANVNLSRISNSFP